MRLPLTRLLTSAILCAALLTPAIANAQDITSDLVRHWTLDETSGTTATDSASGTTATMLGGLDASNDSASSGLSTGTALSFDGDDYIEGTSDGNITYPVTFSAWIRTDTSHSGVILSYERSNSTIGTFGIVQRGDTVRVASRMGSTLIGTGTTATTPTNTGAWFHIVGVMDTGNISRIYVNGTLESTGSLDTTLTGTGNNYIGAQNNSGSGIMNFFQGDIDDARLYRRALSDTDITTLYNTGRGFTCFNPNAVTGALTYNDDLGVMQLCNGTDWRAIGTAKSKDNSLIGHWKLDETSGTTISDSSDNGYTGTMQNAMTADNATTDGTREKALTFNSANNEYINIGPISEVLGASQMSVSAWIKKDSANNNVHVWNGDNPYQSAYGLGFYTDGRLWGGVNDGSSGGNTFVYTPTINDTNWHHAVMVYDGTQATNTDRVKLYVDTVDTSLTYTGTIPSAMHTDATKDLKIGHFNGSAYTNGSIDDVRIYNRALSSADIVELYDNSSQCTAPTDNLVAHWKLDETSGATVADSTSNGNDGTWVDGGNNEVGEETVNGQVNQALSFNGSTNEVIIPTNSGTDIAAGGDLSLSAWVNPNAAGFMLTQGTRGSAYNYYISLNSSRRIAFYNGTPSTDAIPFSTWSHIAVTKSGSTITYYINGVASGTTTQNNTGTQGRPFRIGGNGTDRFDGIIDDVRAYDRALSAEEVSLLYGGTGGLCTITDKCISPVEPERSILYNTSDHVMQYCNGDDWVAMGPAGDGGGGCTDPVGAAGDMVYNGLFNMLQYCEGDEWIAANALTPPETPTDGLVGHWRLDETSGTSIVDSSGEGNTGTASSFDAATNTRAGQVGTALFFDESTNQKVIIPHDSSLSLVSEGTVSAWVKLENDQIGQDKDWPIFWKQAHTNSRNAGGYYLRLYQGNAGAPIYLTSRFGGSATSHITSHPFASGIWYHVAMTWEDSTVQFYIDGELVHSQAQPATISYLQGANANIGSGPLGINSKAPDGTIDDVRVYNRALHSAEIKVMYDNDQ